MIYKLCNGCSAENIESSKELCKLCTIVKINMEKNKCKICMHPITQYKGKKKNDVSKNNYDYVKTYICFKCWSNKTLCNSCNSCLTPNRTYEYFNIYTHEFDISLCICVHCYNIKQKQRNLVMCNNCELLCGKHEYIKNNKECLSCDNCKHKILKHRKCINCKKYIKILHQHLSYKLSRYEIDNKYLDLCVFCYANVNEIFKCNLYAYMCICKMKSLYRNKILYIGHTFNEVKNVNYNNIFQYTQTVNRIMRYKKSIEKYNIEYKHLVRIMNKLPTDIVHIICSYIIELKNENQYSYNLHK